MRWIVAALAALCLFSLGGCTEPKAPPEPLPESSPAPVSSTQIPAMTESSE